MPRKGLIKGEFLEDSDTMGCTLAEWVKNNKKNFNERDLNFLLVSLFKQSQAYPKDSQTTISLQDYIKLESLLAQYQQGVPLAYLLGYEEFYGMTFIVTPQVLIPRPETEIIVEQAISLINNNKLHFVLDLCCGCLNVGLAIEQNVRVPLTIYASDVSLSALTIAKKNRDTFTSSIFLVHTDLFQGFRRNCFDLIVANPPYVEDEYIRDSLQYEPRRALSGGFDGMYYLKKIIGQASQYLRKDGFLLLEIGFQQKEKVEVLLSHSNDFAFVKWLVDYAGYFRGILLKKNTQDK